MPSLSDSVILPWPQARGPAWSCADVLTISGILLSLQLYKGGPSPVAFADVQEAGAL